MGRARRNPISGLLVAGLTIGIAIFAVLALFAVWMSASRPPAPAILMDATDLANEYRENPAATIEDFRGKVIELTNVNVKGMDQGFGELWNLHCEYPIHGTNKLGTYRIRCSGKFAAKVDKNFVQTFHVTFADDLLGEMCLVIH